jgi:Uma2 family endonuclease
MYALPSPQLSNRPVVYPDSDGMPMADNTLQYEWIVTIKGGLDTALPDFVGGDLLWYPVEGRPEIRVAPDVLVALGRPKGHRGSYRQWEEGGQAPQVVFEILSPGNRPMEMARKFSFYSRYGVQEYYLYDPDENALLGYQRRGEHLADLEQMDGWVSPLLGIRFQLSGGQFKIFHADGRPFLSFSELTDLAAREGRRADEAMAQAIQATAQAEQESRRAEQAMALAAEEAHRAQEAVARAAALEARLRALGMEL